MILRYHFYWLWSIRRWNPQIIVTNRSVTKSQFIAQICSRMQRGCTDVINNICANCKDTWGTLLHRTPVRCHTHSQTILLANHASKLCSVTIMRIYACTTIFRLPMFFCSYRKFKYTKIYKIPILFENRKNIHSTNYI